MSREFVGFALAPVGALIVLCGVFWGYGSLSAVFVSHASLIGRADGRRDIDILDTLRGVWALARVVFPLGYLVEACVAAPLHVQLQRRDRISFVTYCGVGAVAGVAPFLFYGLLTTVSMLRSPFSFRFPGEVWFAPALGESRSRSLTLETRGISQAPLRK
jgi:hypothetical protein